MRLLTKFALPLLIVAELLSGCINTTTESKNIFIEIFDKNTMIFQQQLETNEDTIDVLLDNLNIDLITENGPYGEYIKSIMGLEQKNTDDGMYYWAFYIDNEYASTGISQTKIEGGKTYKFIYNLYVEQIC